MGIDLKHLEDMGISTSEGIGYTGGEDWYISALQRYFKSYENNRKSIEEYLSVADLENYAIKVHALKSNSKMIGAAKLGGMFEELELAAKDGNKGALGEKTESVLEAYRELIEILRPIGEAEQVKSPDEISAEEARETLHKLLAALDDFDDEKSADLAAKLGGYPFRLTQKEKLKEATELISDFMYDEAAELIREIEPAIE